MGLLEKYYEYKKGELLHINDKNLLRFFKTKPSDDQLLFINKAMKRQEALTYIGILIYLVLGVLVGYASGFLVGIRF